MDKRYICSSHESFIETLYEENKVLLLNTIRKYIGPSEDCEDVFQEVFIRIMENANNLSQFPQDKLKAYILLIAHGVSIDYLRKQYRNPEISLDDDILMNMVSIAKNLSVANDPFNKVDLSMIMETVSLEEQTLLIGKYYLGLSGNELARIVGGSAIAVRSQLHRAKKRVFNEWRKAGLRLEDFY
jgi:RNA polymerase sigma factor (sigma-70 family)